MNATRALARQPLIRFLGKRTTPSRMFYSRRALLRVTNIELQTLITPRTCTLPLT